MEAPNYKTFNNGIPHNLDIDDIRTNDINPNKLMIGFTASVKMKREITQAGQAEISLLAGNNRAFGINIHRASKWRTVNYLVGFSAWCQVF